MATRRTVNGRVATQADVDAGAVIFFIPGGRSVPYSLGEIYRCERVVSLRTPEFPSEPK